MSRGKVFAYGTALTVGGILLGSALWGQDVIHIRDESRGTFVVPQPTATFQLPVAPRFEVEDADDTAIVRTHPRPIESTKQLRYVVPAAAAAIQAQSVDKQVRALQTLLRTKIAGEAVATESDRQLDLALSRYLARSKVQQAVSTLEEIIQEAPGTPEARQAAAAIDVLNPPPQHAEGSEPNVPDAEASEP